MKLARAAVLVVAAACSKGPPAEPPRPPADAGVATTEPDAGPSIDEIRLVAFADVMKHSNAASHGCWERAAADDYHLAGQVDLLIHFDAAGKPTQVDVVRDSTGDAVLTGCLQRLYQGWAWPPVFDDKSAVKVPFVFEAPGGQYTVQRDNVVALEQANRAKVWLLLNPRNAGNPAAALSILELPAGAAVPLHRHPAATEVLYLVRGHGVLSDFGGTKRGRAVGPGSFLYLPVAKEHAFLASDEVEAIQLYTPAGPEQRFRPDGPTDGTEPVKPHKPARNAPPLRVVDAAQLPAALPILGGKGRVIIGFEAANAGDGAAYAGILELDAGVQVPEHAHPDATELLYLFEGSGTLTVAGKPYPVAAGSAVQVPPGVKHAFTATSAVRALQAYTPSGPEQRFKAAPTPAAR